MGLLNYLVSDIMLSWWFDVACLQNSGGDAWAREFATDQVHHGLIEDQWVNELSKLLLQDWGEQFIQQVNEVFSDTAADEWANSFDGQILNSCSCCHDFANNFILWLLSFFILKMDFDRYLTEKQWSTSLTSGDLMVQALFMFFWYEPISRSSKSTSRRKGPFL